MCMEGKQDLLDDLVRQLARFELPSYIKYDSSKQMFHHTLIGTIKSSSSNSTNKAKLDGIG